ncbi:hypothetical protein SAMN05421736_107183 [Evansella caseinilytica]|uniref:Uncharacterized protein n=1 Tax=Evansella caseinilytica TaxID=1503961 RepID=A0A1H3R559_9BACI|nr:hypothetical protein [Evansella caseinilytica]SDZ20358.1 hypothetical protein SAMN05421736_107183 [Evansella caseinilytica]
MADDWNKKFVLKHKNVPVVELELDEATGAISAIGHVYDERHVPVGIPVKKVVSIAPHSMNGGGGAPFLPAGTVLKKH